MKSVFKPYWGRNSGEEWLNLIKETQKRTANITNSKLALPNKKTWNWFSVYIWVQDYVHWYLAKKQIRWYLMKIKREFSSIIYIFSIQTSAVGWVFIRITKPMNTQNMFLWKNLDNFNFTLIAANYPLTIITIINTGITILYSLKVSSYHQNPLCLLNCWVFST